VSGRSLWALTEWLLLLIWSRGETLLLANEGANGLRMNCCGGAQFRGSTKSLLVFVRVTHTTGRLWQRCRETLSEELFVCCLLPSAA
jgi:hypothetical protein